MHATNIDIQATGIYMAEIAIDRRETNINIQETTVRSWEIAAHIQETSVNCREMTIYIREIGANRREMRSKLRKCSKRWKMRRARDKKAISSENPSYCPQIRSVGRIQRALRAPGNPLFQQGLADAIAKSPPQSHSRQHHLGS